VDIKLRDRTASKLEDIISPEDKLVFRCLVCEEYLLPKEYHVLGKRWRAKDGYVYAMAFELCPVCYPNPESLTKEELIQASPYAVMTREEFLIQRRYEKAGILPPEQRTLLQNVH